ncbi:acyl-CoA dehydrogenase family protein [Actinophytocola oryzae]|uniref:Alkylation response protein AidB-like acyl-CoA dehydrogenase n=1 Tax=Actinophytocola oryzae TaxID=502181 RepID=A0A4V3FUQ9_9PSEU|nr:acyl-CoA dehydrogenase family protein [Actinophytocola oryzae]TDV56211.1 alkylation response protein AidB-like acyl-CoA dehydrogenase [Actinophytocola oryzae]
MYTETPEQALLRASVRKLARGYGHEYWLRQARDPERTDEQWLELGRNGYLGVNFPEEYGGGGGGVAELAIVCEELAAAGTPSFMLIVSSSICGELLVRHGTDEQRGYWLPRMAGGSTKLCFSITEPDAGSNTHKLSTVARQDGEDWVLNGTKYYASGVDQAEAVVVVARTGTDPDTGRGRLSLFLVPTDAPGLQRTLIPVEVTAPEKQFTLFFDDVRLPASAMIGTEGEGMRQVFGGLNPERIMAAAFENGIALYALEKASTYAGDRKVWDVPIGAHQGVAHMLAKSKIEVELARLMTQKAAWLHDNSEPAGEAANMAKYAAAEACLAALDNAIQTHGGNGFATEYGLATLWGAARLQRTTPVSREMIFNFVAQHSLGLPRSY